MPVIRLETFIKAPPEVCFDLARSVEVFTTATDHAKMRAVAGKTSGMLNLNDTVTWEVTAGLGIRQRITSRFTSFDRPRMFVDEIERGAFKRWHHKHVFESKPEGTLLTDEVNYESPFGALGRLAEALCLENYMRNFLIIHNAHVKEIAEQKVARNHRAS